MSQRSINLVVVVTLLRARPAMTEPPNMIVDNDLLDLFVPPPRLSHISLMNVLDYFSGPFLTFISLPPAHWPFLDRINFSIWCASPIVMNHWVLAPMHLRHWKGGSCGLTSVGKRLVSSQLFVLITVPETMAAPATFTWSQERRLVKPPPLQKRSM